MKNLLEMTANEIVTMKLENITKNVLSESDLVFMKYDCIKDIYENANNNLDYNFNSIAEQVENVLNDLTLTETEKEKEINNITEYNSRSYNNMNSLIRYTVSKDIARKMLQLLK